MANEGTQINVSQGFNAVVLNGVSIEQAADGHLVITAPGTVFTKAGVANDRAASNPGDRMPDGRIYAGISPDTHKPMYTTPEDAPLTYTFNEARKYAAELEANGHKDWRVPTKAELKVLFNNRAAIGGFDASGLNPGGWYWSSTEHGHY